MTPPATARRSALTGRRRILPGALLALALLAGSAVSTARAQPPAERLDPLLGAADAVLLVDPSGRTHYAHQPRTALIPASTLKVLTALGALHHLGPSFRFETNIYLDSDGVLTVRGSGDPLLISEVLADLGRQVARKVKRIAGIRLDDSAFDIRRPLPGVGDGRPDPYNAPNGALCVNFNTVLFTTDGDGRRVSAEPQTPLLPMTAGRIAASGLEYGRIVIGPENRDHLLYAGRMIRHFLIKAGVDCRGPVRFGRVRPGRDKRLLTFRSPYPLTEVVKRLLTYSNNFMANQLLLAMGAHCSGVPGTRRKGVDALMAAIGGPHRPKGLTVVEGSGISRRNRATGQALMAVLGGFAPYRGLMTCDGADCFKTGTLRGIRTRVGYLEPASSAAAGPWRYVVLINTPGRDPAPVMREIRRYVRGRLSPARE
jgi:D-alanyl-D-alanine carboxypeptidase/D-alanyl-D-alanine-endopeptidase (penicillin-binding protein 4)